MRTDHPKKYKENSPYICGIYAKVISTVFAQIELNEYTNRVLNVLKAKFSLKDKSEAINKFAEIYGDEIVEKEANDQYVKKIIGITENHMKKYSGRKMTLKELDSICGLD